MVLHGFTIQKHPDGNGQDCIEKRLSKDQDGTPSTQDSPQTPTWSGRSTGSAIRLRMLALGFTVAQYSGCDLAMANLISEAETLIKAYWEPNTVGPQSPWPICSGIQHLI